MALGDAAILSELSAMREAQREDHGTVVSKVDSLVTVVNDGFKAVAVLQAAHELSDTRLFNALDRRLRPLETVHKTLRWVAATGVGAIILGFFDFVFNHLPKVLHAAR